MKLSVGAERVLEALSEFETYVVGGCVRDDLLGFKIHDYDICTSALPNEIKECCKSYQIVETGIKHGTVTVLTPDPIEVTTFRVESGYSDGRRPDSVSFTSNIVEDLRRRDFTVNAIAYHPKKGYIDPFHGKEDGEKGILRAVGNPYERFEEDALRILRGIRFASRFSFQIEEETAKAMHQMKDKLHNVSAERIYVELCGFLMGQDVVRVGKEFADVLFTIIPELKESFGFEQHNHHHEYDIYEHILHSVQESRKDLTVRLTMLLHDVGKPSTFAFVNGEGHFYGHANVSEKMADDILKRLKTDHDTREKVKLLIRYHDYPVIYEGDHAKKAVARLVRKIGKDAFYQLCDVKRADSRALAKKYREQRVASIDTVQAIYEQMERENTCFSLKDLAINGYDLMNKGYQGKEIGLILNEVLNRVVDGDLVNEREIILNFIDANEQFLLSKH